MLVRERSRRIDLGEGERLANADVPCVAWQNETLCKIVYVTCGLTVEHEQRTGSRMNSLMDTFFPALEALGRAIA
jgi:hypothetical protein